ncbi:MAG: SpoIID/LytB domain-containing protein [Armatimonadetes bacterium]|nr:SpoIID/LytB domain-containing protein [Armatimonadota bacterium]
MRFKSPILIVGAVAGILALGAQIHSQNRALAQLPVNSPDAVSAAIRNLPAPPAAGARRQASGARVVARPTPIPTLKPRFVGQKTIRVGLSTAGGAIAVYAPDGATLFDLEQPGLTLSLPAGARFGFAFGAERTSKRGAKTFRGPISVSTAGGLSDGWKRVYIAVSGNPARVSTNNNSPRYGRPYRGDLEVFPQKLPEPIKRKGALALVNVVPLEAYLKGVVPWEMSPSAPLEALKAQAICARTKTLDFVQSKRFAAGDFEICDYDACQGYPGTENEKPATSQAVESTKGLALYHRGRPIDAVYSTNSGGVTANARDVWKGTTPITYLQSVPDFPANSPLAGLWKGGMTEAEWGQFCAQPWPSYARPDGVASTRYEARKYRWTQFVSAEEARRAFTGDGLSQVLSLEVAERTPSGRIRRLRVTGVDAARERLMPTPFSSAPLTKTASLPLKVVEFEGDGKIRAMFSKQLGSTTALPSSLFVITPIAGVNGQVSGWNLQGAGWGHGVGMCQRGAQNHAREGWDARKILNWYYRGVEIRRVN